LYDIDKIREKLLFFGRLKDQISPKPYMNTAEIWADNYKKKSWLRWP
jgi:hypothetical protein